MTPTLPIGGALRNARKAQKLSLTEVAAAASISTSTLSRIENDKQNLDVALLIAIANVLQVAPADLIGTGDSPETEEALVHRLAVLPAEKRARVVADASRRSARGRAPEQLQAQLDSLLATVDLIRDELTDVQRQVSRRRR